MPRAILIAAISTAVTAVAPAPAAAEVDCLWTPRPCPAGHECGWDAERQIHRCLPVTPPGDGKPPNPPPDAGPAPDATPGPRRPGPQGSTGEGGRPSLHSPQPVEASPGPGRH